MNKVHFFPLLLFLFATLDFFLWPQIFWDGAARPGDYFLDVGQGDSELVIFPDGAKILTDAGPDASVAAAIAKILPAGDRYIDLAVITHPQLDHCNGFNFLLDQYTFGAFIWNGRDDDPPTASWSALKQKIAVQKIPVVTLARGDSIVSGNARDDILSPDAELDQSAELNDTGYVERITTPAFMTLLTADTGMNVENFLIARGDDLHADVLKVGHHGSKYASGDAFLRAVDPAVAVIEVGARNTYGHPASSTLARIVSSTHAQIFRTDQDGTVSVFKENGKLIVQTER